MKTHATIAMALAVLFGGPAAAGDSASIPMTVTVVEPALSLSIETVQVQFGGNVQSDATYTAVEGLEITIEDRATLNQATTGWHLVASGSVLSSGGGSIEAERMSFHPGHLASVTPGPGAGPSPPVEPAGVAQTLDAPVRLLQSAGPNDSKGRYRVVWAPEALSLFVPGSTGAGTYTGLLSLTLSRGL